MNFCRVDLRNSNHADHWLMLLNSYAMDAMGGGEPLSQEVQSALIPQLVERENFVSFIAYDGDLPIGLINAFEGFSTFAAKPLLNIHDMFVMSSHRGRGISQRLMAAMADHGKRIGCCKLTLEVLQKNTSAQEAYRKFGFQPYSLDSQYGDALFWQYAINQ